MSEGLQPNPNTGQGAAAPRDGARPLPLDHAPPPKSASRYYLVIACGIVSTILALVVVYLLQNKADTNVMGWYADYVIPGGALVGVRSVNSTEALYGTWDEFQAGMAGQFASRAEAAEAWAAYKASNGMIAEAVESAAAVNGNSLLSTRTAYLYQLFDEEGNFLKWGVTQDMGARYPQWFMDEHQLLEFAQGSRADMIAMERGLVETQPGPLNFEPWAGARLGGQP